jgi:hypothetical protein
MWKEGNLSAKRILRYVVIFLLGFGAGIAGTYFVGYQFFLRPHLWMAAVGESFMANQYAYMQYREASYTEAVKAMEAYLAYFDRIKPSPRSGWSPGQDPWLDSRGIRFDKMLVWARLALLHERNNNIEASNYAWTQAEALAAEIKWKDPSRDHLRSVIERSDQQWNKGMGKNKK